MSAVLAPERASGRARSRWGLFARRDFRLLWAGETVSKLGSNITSVALPLVAVLALDAGPLATGALTAAVWLPWLVFGLPAGVWVGRVPRRTVMIACNLASAVLFASVPVAGWFGALTLAQLLVVAVSTGVSSVFFDAAFEAYLPELVAPEDLIEGNAKLQGSASAAAVAGRGLAGLTVQLLGATTGLLADAASFLVATVTLLRIRARPRPAPAGTAAEGTLRQAREGLVFLLRDPYLRSFTLYGAAANFALTGYQSITALFLIREAGVAPGWVGGLASAGAVGGVLGALAARPLCRRLGTARALRTVLVALSPFGMLMALAGPGPGMLLYLVGALVVVAAVVFCNVVLDSFRQSYLPPALLSRVAATSMCANHATIPLGALAGGALGAVIGLRATMWVMTGLLALCAALPLLSPLRTVRELPTGAAEAVR
ncbi:putative MFS family arabinose efflux permease [Streptomyces sp. 1114.5]|uniref:MFS transporter n=1 Tax=unclassified Streptomyces TaxID=2593676 RepID=UPI000BD10A49|nr:MULTISPECIES: MFS transporter [unclassified Streptomyces]RKT19262.1 putative MFS family arabinose efflux permease [Streptomyces sp. 1114.5]SOB85459.1 Predicted arabinose efflux permease, MFS family [Streptomyces sp. 1331.2]